MNLDKFRIEILDEKFIKKYNTYMKSFKIIFNELPNNFISTIELLYETIDKILLTIKDTTDNDDKMKKNTELLSIKLDTDFCINSK